MQAFRSYHATLEKSDIIKTSLRNTGFLANEGKIYLEFCTKSTWPKTEIIETCIAYNLKRWSTNSKTEFGIPNSPSLQILGKTQTALFPVPTILDNTFGTRWRNPLKLDRTRKVWYLLLPGFWLLLPKVNFWKGDWALGYVSTQIWDVPNISLFPKIVTLKSFGNSWGNS